MANFPTKGSGAGFLAKGESPSKYEIDEEDNEVKADTDGGYEIKRQRFTRSAPVLITTGFIGLSHTDYLTLRAFWDTHKTTVAFTYYDYMHGVSRQMRFDSKPKWDYTGIGTNRMWNPVFKMKEV